MSLEEWALRERAKGRSDKEIREQLIRNGYPEDKIPYILDAPLVSSSGLQNFSQKASYLRFISVGIGFLIIGSFYILPFFDVQGTQAEQDCAAGTVRYGNYCVWPCFEDGPKITFAGNTYVDYCDDNRLMDYRCSEAVAISLHNVSCENCILGRCVLPGIPK